MNLKKLLTRTVSGLIYAAVIICCILLGSDGILALAVLFSALASLEFTKIGGYLNKSRTPAVILDLAGCICLSCSYYIIPFFIWILVIMARFITELYMKSENPVRNLAFSMMSQLYIALPMALLVVTGNSFASTNVLLAMFFFIWLSDTGAFIVGSLFGRHRLFERISPKKSWEGFFGGLLFNIGFAFLFCYCLNDFFGLPRNIFLWVGWSVIATIFATWGDLVESLIKRTLHIKDSGNIIPGHGGILDRIDSLLFVAPATYLYLVCYYAYFL